MVSAAATIGFRRAIRSPHRHETRETALKAGSKRVLGVAAAILLIAGGAEARITRIEIVVKRAGVRRGVVWRRRRLCSPGRPGPRRARSGRSRQFPHPGHRPCAAQRARHGRIFDQYRTPEARRPCTQQPRAPVRGQQPRQQARARQFQRGRRRNARRPERPDFARRRLAHALRLHAGVVRLGNGRARRHEPDRHAAGCRPQPRRLAGYGYRPLGDDHAEAGDQHPDQLEPADPELSRRQL